MQQAKLSTTVTVKQNTRVEDLGNGATLDMVSIPGGTFMMGAKDGEKDSSDSERPQHKVTVQPFFMGKYPVTQLQWHAVAALPKINRELKTESSQFKGHNLPVERISWYDAVEFCERLSKFSGRNYRLPSEAEWEYACRAGTTTPFYFGETITSKIANFHGEYQYANAPKSESRKKTTSVGIFPPNAFGLYDTHGNVYEWCADDWHENYSGAPNDGSTWSYDYDYDYPKLLRGGSWDIYPQDCRSAYRDRNTPDIHNLVIGFRVVCGGAARTI